MTNLIVAVLVLFSIIAINGAFKIQPKMVNGYRAELAQFPYFAFLEIQKPDADGACGGTLLNGKWILTAAHCLTDAQSAFIHLGESRLDLDEMSHVTITAEKENLHIHPDFFKKPVLNDLGLIELPEEVQFSKFIKPVHLPENCDVPEIVDVIAMGHGSISDDSGASSQLHFANLKTRPQSVCQNAFPFLNGANSVICAANKPFYQSICRGDSGGPLVTQSNETLIGVASYVTPGGCENGEPQGFSRLHSHLEWIKNITQLNLPTC